MCVILQIEPNVKFPTDKLERACDINPDGYGIAYLDKGIQVIRSVAKNDPKEVADHLQRLNDRRVFVHLRYATVGEVSLENSHPFVLLSHRKVGDIAMMHNGTLSAYSPKEKGVSDTKIFADTFAGPAVARIAAFAGSNKVLHDPIFQKIADMDAGVSVLVFFDRWGNVLKINQQRGKQFEGWWASNDYSFDDKHMRSSVRHISSTPNYRNVSHIRNYQNRGYGRNRGLPWQEDTIHDPVSDQMAEAWRKHTGTQHIPSTNRIPMIGSHLVESSAPYSAAGFLALQSQTKAVGMTIQNAKENEASIRNLSVTRKTFCEMAGLTSLDDLGHLTQKDIEELCKNYPSGMAQMFTDLYGEMRDHKRNRENQARAILQLTADKKVDGAVA